MYTARVVAVNDFGSSYPSSNNTATTLEDGTNTILNNYYFSKLIDVRFRSKFVSEPSAPPNNVEAIDIETKQMTIRWKVSNLPTIGYLFKYY